MTIEEMRNRKTQLGLTNEMISELSGIPLSTIQKIMSGATKAPRKVTLEAVEAVLYAEELRRQRSVIHGASGRSGVTYDDSGEPSPELMKENAGGHNLSSTASKKDGEYTLDDYYALPNERRVELIDGVFYDMAAPTFLHQLILSHLSIQFYDCAEQHDMPCEVFQSPCDVRLDRDNYTVVQPDLLVICSPQDYLHMKRLDGAPDLAVEILSPSTRSKDMILKLYKYEKAGVREYWIVDPEHRTVTVHFFDTDVYDPVRYSFHDQIPVGISEGKCSIDFSRIERRLAQYE